MITVKEYLGKFAGHEELTDEHLKSAKILVAKVSEFMARIGAPSNLIITSGFRPRSYNKQVGGSMNSHHCFCRAIDIFDPQRVIGQQMMHNLEAMAEIGLWAESLMATHYKGGVLRPPNGRWIHLQMVPPKSGNRVFMP